MQDASGIEVERQRQRQLGEQAMNCSTNSAPKAIERRNVDQVLESDEIVGYFSRSGARWRTVGDELENRIGTQRVVIILILIASARMPKMRVRLISRNV